MVIKAKYITALILIVLFCSGLIYEVTGKSNSFSFILLGISLGSALGITSYCASVHWGSKLLSKIFKDY
jgi:hypothetical protein